MSTAALNPATLHVGATELEVPFTLLRSNFRHVTKRKPQHCTHRVNELVVQGSAQWGNRSETPACVLADTGSQAFALAATTSFPPVTLVPARKPLAISSVGGEEVL